MTSEQCTETSFISPGHISLEELLNSQTDTPRSDVAQTLSTMQPIPKRPHGMDFKLVGPPNRPGSVHESERASHTSRGSSATGVRSSSHSSHGADNRSFTTDTSAPFLSRPGSPSWLNVRHEFLDPSQVSKRLEYIPYKPSPSPGSSTISSQNREPQQFFENMKVPLRPRSAGSRSGDRFLPPIQLIDAVLSPELRGETVDYERGRSKTRVGESETIIPDL